jgi:hypothetical protein
MVFFVVRRFTPGAIKDLTQDHLRGISMNESLFDELVASVKEGGAILRGEPYYK